jgi:uncharacterized protein (TIGR02449 family)
MEDALTALEAKIAEAVARCRELRADNEALRAQLASVAAERDRLGDKLDAARLRLETLLGQLPEA